MWLYRRTSEVDPARSPSGYASGGVDDWGNTQTDWSGSGTITHAYDPAGNVKAATDSTGGGSTISTISSTFYLDSKPRTVDNGTKTNKYTYDGAGQTAARVDVTDAGGATASTTTYSFGDAGLPLSMTASAPAGTTSWTDNALGQQTRENDPNGQYTTFSYNPDNSLSQKVLYNSSNTILNSWAYTYDAVNHILQQTTPSLTTYYQYDNANRVCYYSTTTAPPAPPNRCQNATYTYDPDGNRQRDSYGNTFTNNANQMNSGTPFTYTAFQALQSDGTSHTYDGFDRMTGSGSNNYQYDALDRQRNAKEAIDSGFLVHLHPDPTAWTRPDYLTVEEQVRRSTNTAAGYCESLLE